MSEYFENRVIRPLRVFTEVGVFDGLLNVSLGARTLDELNQTARASLCLASPCLVGGEWPVGEGPLIVNKAGVLFALEIPDLGVTLGTTAAAPLLQHHARSMIRLRVGPYDVQGYVHTLQGADPVARLNHPGSRPFLALTSVTIQGNGVEFATPFVAVNQPHVLVAQEILSIQALPEDAAAV